ncbi:transcription repressor NadR [Dethiobacter alkaliphilus]|uniref:transcription repressor NadR n=1 Tax=Dethiobacter alkaliphilus TaxID=427926 RepID=UPI00222633D7|nr:transcription repressor NadR [Dethiobacter alkaliphilus]MCW3491445.1 transcription repressor NadR [Dethiobacter alkaliphilus]
MEAEKRREELLRSLREAEKPVTGGDLAQRFGVSRQVIVQDIAILRAAGEQILATPQGYMIPLNQAAAAVQAVLACRHTPQEIEAEIGIVVDLGGKVLDVVVEHPVYGEMRGNLMISSRRDLNHFLERLAVTEARPLAELTDGVHLHTIEAPNNRVLEEIIAGLRAAHFLVD